MILPALFLKILVVTALILAAATPFILLVLFFIDLKSEEIW